MDDLVNPEKRSDATENNSAERAKNVFAEWRKAEAEKMKFRNEIYGNMEEAEMKFLANEIAKAFMTSQSSKYSLTSRYEFTQDYLSTYETALKEITEIKENKSTKSFFR